MDKMQPWSMQPYSGEYWLNYQSSSPAIMQ